MGEMVKIKANDRDVSAYMAVHESGSGPGILLMHAWWGLNSFFTSFADRLAAEGFVVLAPDLYGGKTASEIEDAKVLITELEKDQGYRKVIKVEEAALDYLLSNPAAQENKVGTMGFSMGGSYALWLASLRPEISAVVLFYGGSDQGSDYDSPNEAAFLGHFAEGDEWESDEGVEQLQARLQAAGHDATFHFYSGVGHWFMEDNRPDVYNHEAAQLAWERTLRFLHERLDK